LQNGTRPVLGADVNLKTLGESTECSGYTGADLAALVREAGIEALKETISSSDTTRKLVVSNRHFLKALEKIRPSVSEKVCIYSLHHTLPDQKINEEIKRLLRILQVTEFIERRRRNWKYHINRMGCNRIPKKI
jgi:SpoVK/Ycf46/Vps4 family AAA+-type ATPase